MVRPSEIVAATAAPPRDWAGRYPPSSSTSPHAKLPAGRRQAQVRDGAAAAARVGGTPVERVAAKVDRSYPDRQGQPTPPRDDRDALFVRHALLALERRAERRRRRRGVVAGAVCWRLLR